MNVQQDNPERKIIALVSSLEADPHSWKDWLALYICVPQGPDEKIKDMLQAISAQYLKSVEGEIYICDGKHVFIFGKTASENIFYHAAQALSKELGDPENRTIYHLERDAAPFSQLVFNAIGEKFSIHVSNDGAQNHIQKSNGSVSKDPLKVLLVEDDTVIRWMVDNALKDECDVEYADTANKVFALYPSYAPDIVLLDIGLPDNSGQAVLDWIMRNDPAANVIMVSSKTSADTISSCLEKGAKGFIPKPFVKDDLLHYIQKYR